MNNDISYTIVWLQDLQENTFLFSHEKWTNLQVI